MPAAPSPMKCWCRHSSRARSRKRKRCSAAASLLGFHAYRQIAPAPAAARRSSKASARPQLRAACRPNRTRISAGTARCRSIASCPTMVRAPLLIDCNPRLVEPMSAYLAGLDLVGLLLRLSLGETPAACRKAATACQTHLAMQALLGCAARGGTRRDLIRECWQSRDRRRTLCRQHRGTDAGAAGLDQRGAAGDGRLAAARRAEARCRPRPRRLGRASARYREYPAH